MPEDTKLPPVILTVQPLVVTLTDTGISPTVIEFEVTVALGSCSVAFVKSLGLKVGYAISCCNSKVLVMFQQ